MDFKKKATDRLIRYAKIMTPSREDSDSFPSTAVQFDLARVLVDELKELGMEDAFVDDYCYVYASIPATPGKEKCPVIGFISHMDTVSDYTKKQVNPLVWEDYDGKDLTLPSGRVISCSDFPHLASLKGRTLVTSDGNTILGADDKAGVAEIITMAEYLLRSSMPHGRICIAFTPDEEIGKGPAHFDVEGFGADYAYTVDGGVEGSIEYESFYAANVKFIIHGKGIHPGEAKGIMVNASLVAMHINSMIPENEIPANTSGYEGFYHLCEMEGSVEEASLFYIVRDHDLEKYHRRLDYLSYIEKSIKQVYGDDVVDLIVKESYRNMKDKIRPHFHLIENARKAAIRTGAEPVTLPIRGGTDGAMLSFMGLPCPNLGTGGYACHGPYEHVTGEGMETVVKILLEIVKTYA